MEATVGLFIILALGSFNVLEAVSPFFEDETNGNQIDEEILTIDSIENDTSEVYFTLFPPGSSNKDGIPICVDNSSEYLKSIFKTGVQTKFIVHGWLSSGESDTVNFTANEYRRLQEGNIVKVDWSYDASWKFYPLSALQVAYIGGKVATLLNKLLLIQAINLEALHLIGHSLGAHVMGNAGSYIIGGKAARITGLDPAKPGFEGMTPETYRLDQNDAHFVDVIHSAAGAAGYYYALGHVDFYPNGGTPPQPGCFDMSQPWQLMGCSHGRSYYYFIESISNPKGFPAIECDSWSNFKSGACDNNSLIFMGDRTPSTARGIYYLETNSEPPYAMG